MRNVKTKYQTLDKLLLGSTKDICFYKYSILFLIKLGFYRSFKTHICRCSGKNL